MGHPILQLVPILEQILEQVEKKLNASNQQNRKQEPYPNDGQCRPAWVVEHTTYSLYDGEKRDVRETVQDDDRCLNLLVLQRITPGGDGTALELSPGASSTRTGAGPRTASPA